MGRLLVDGGGEVGRRAGTDDLAGRGEALADDRVGVPLAQLRSEMPEHRRRWDEALSDLEAGSLHAAIRKRQDYPDTDPAEAMLLIQTIHHGNDHRTQVCSTLGALGEEVPELDGWDFWAHGRT